MCFGPLSAKIEEDGDTGKLVEILQCKVCQTTYYWPSNQWCEPSSDPSMIDTPGARAEEKGCLAVEMVYADVA